MPFADFCHAVKAGFPSFSRCRFRVNDTWQISRGKTRILPRIDAGFTTCTLAGVATGAVDKGLRGHVPAGPECTTPHIRFLFIVPRFRLGLPLHPASRRRTCPLANLRLYMPGIGTFTRLDSCHARHRQGKRRCAALSRSVRVDRWVGLSVLEKLIKCESNVFGDLAEQDWRDVPAFMKWYRCAAACGIAELFVRSALTNLSETKFD